MSVDDDTPLRFDEPPLTVDRSCPTCHGAGVVEDAGRFLECPCLLQQRVSYYLTARYGPAIKWDPSFRPEPYLGRDVLIENTGGLPTSQFWGQTSAVVKSFLLATDRRFSHRTLTPYDIAQLWFNNHAEHRLDELAESIAVLILLFDIDPPNASYKSVLPWLIHQRRDRGLVTWILSSTGLNTDSFDKRYPGLGEPLRERLADGFAKLPLQPAPKW